MQTVYQTDREGYYVGEEIAFDDPLTPGAILIPAGCVTDAPPPVELHQAAKYEGETWTVVPDYRGTVYWLADGSCHQVDTRGVLLPTDALLVEPPPTKAQLTAHMTSMVQKYLDDTARSRGYDNILSLCSYANSTNPTFRDEGQAGVAWRDAVWSKCYEVLVAVQSGERTTPTIGELISELPNIQW